MSNARYSLNVYDETDEIVKVLKSRGITWGSLVDIYERFESITDPNASIELIEEMMLKIFKNATRDDLKGCYVDDMMSVMQQVIALGKKNGLIGENQKRGKRSKN